MQARPSCKLRLAFSATTNNASQQRTKQDACTNCNNEQSNVLIR
jgi:hypothetical protein